MYRFLLTPRWLAGHILVVAAVVFCVFMGSWQLSRFEARVNAQRQADSAPAEAAAAKPVPLASVLPGLGSDVTIDSSGQTVTATGHYDTAAAHQFLVPDRALGTRTGFYVLTLLRVDSGAALPVVRGWLPGDASSAKAVPPAPSGRVTVTGALQAPEGADTDGVDSSGGLPTGQLGMISAASLVNLVPYDVYSAWITQTTTVAPMEAVPPAAPPNTGLDLKAFQNLGYTGEWFVFAGFAVFMWFRLARREAESQRDAALGLLLEEPAPAPDAVPDAVSR